MSRPAWGGDTPRSTPLPLILQAAAKTSVRRHTWRVFVRVATLVVSDLAVLGAARLVARLVRDAAWAGQTAADIAGEIVGRGSFPPLESAAACVIGLGVLGNYGVGDARRDPRRIFAGVLLAVSLIQWRYVWDHATLAAAAGFVATVGALALGLVVSRIVVDAAVRRASPVSQHAPRAILVGDAEEIRHAELGQALSDRREFRIVGRATVEDMRSRGNASWLTALAERMTRLGADTVVVVGQVESSLLTQLARIADSASGQLLWSMQTSPAFVPDLIWRKGEPFLQLTRPAIRGWQLALKRVVDVVAAVVLLLLLSPIMAVVAAAVKLSSRGPVLFRQVRVGQGGNLFHIHKFRTMVVGAEQLREQLATESIYGDARLFKLRNDPRVTVLGRWLRKSSLDELPQLWDVLRGRMSLVGPRPPLPREVDSYEDAHYLRFDMKPGITGPWQVSGRNQVTEFDDVIRLEAEYIRDWSIWKDLAILLRTLPAVLRTSQAH